MPIQPLLRWIILLPLIGAVLNGLALRSKKSAIAGGLASLAALSAFAISIVVILGHDPSFGSWIAVDPWFTWIKTGAVDIGFRLEVTPITSVMLLVITGVG